MCVCCGVTMCMMYCGGFWVIISNAWHVFCRSFVTSVVGAPSSQIASCTYNYVQNNLERREVERERERERER